MCRKLIPHKNHAVLHNIMYLFKLKMLLIYGKQFSMDITIGLSYISETNNNIII